MKNLLSRKNGRCPYYLPIAWLIFLTAILCFTEPAAASQVASHIRTAEKALYDGRTPGAIKELLEKNIEYYRAGAVGPDVMNTLGEVYAKFYLDKFGKALAPGSLAAQAIKAHYEKTGQLIKNMLQIAGEDFMKAATDDEREKARQHLAYALGWMSHYYLDVYEHMLVNRYGGFFAINPPRHKALEMLETAHVYHVMENEKKRAVEKTRKYIARADATPAKFLIEAYNRTYGLSIFDPLVDRELHIKRSATTVEMFMEADAYEYFEGRTSPNLLQLGTHFPTKHVPFKVDYSHVLEPLDVLIPPDGFRVEDSGKETTLKTDIEWTIWDDTLFVGYMSDWYGTVDTTVDAIVDAFNNIATRVHKSGKGILISPQIHTAHYFADMDMDTGQLRSKGEKDAIELSEKFKQKQIKELELEWEILNQREAVLDHGLEYIVLKNFIPKQPSRFINHRSGVWKVRIELKEEIHGRLQLRATLRMKDSGSNASGSFVKAFKFDVYDLNNDNIILPKREKEVIEGKDSYFFTIKQRKPGDAEEPVTPAEPEPEEQEPHIPPVRPKDAGKKTEKDKEEEKCKAEKEKIKGIESALNTGKTAAKEIERRIDEMMKKGKRITGEYHEAEDHGIEAYRASLEVIEAKQQMEKASLGVCEMVEVILNASSKDDVKGLSELMSKEYSDVRKLKSKARKALEKARKEAEKAEKIFKEYKSLIEKIEKLKEKVERHSSDLGSVREAIEQTRESIGREATPSRRSQSSEGEGSGDCIKAINKTIDSKEDELTDVEGDLKKIRNDLTAFVSVKEWLDKMEKVAKDARASADAAEVYYEGLDQLASDAGKCVAAVGKLPMKVYFIISIEGSGPLQMWGAVYIQNGMNEEVLVLERAQSLLAALQAKRDALLAGDICERLKPYSYPGPPKGPGIWNRGPKVTVVEGPFVNENEFSGRKLKDTWRTTDRDGPSLDGLRKQCK